MFICMTCVYKYILHIHIHINIRASKPHLKMLYVKYLQSQFQFFFILRDNSFRKVAILIHPCASELNPYSHISFSDDLSMKCCFIKRKAMQIKSKLCNRCFCLASAGLWKFVFFFFRGRVRKLCVDIL